MTDEEIDADILSRTRERGGSKTVCPSEVARSLAPQDWRPLMDSVRQRARTLALAGRIDITQSGEVIDPSAEWKGPIRLRHREVD
ncbi:DUF3253 domain-containing protein [Lewinella sp. IMCC34191]|uniref:DUF3253 domain-containing protein n=1 Tax=Lewinella sp. IMCC34191 TaxID=2259172 RepID=UPI000E284F2B